MQNSLFISTFDAARVLSISQRSVRNLVAAGKLHAFRPVIGGRKFLLYAEEVQAYAQAAQVDSQLAALQNVNRLRQLLAKAAR